MTDRFCMSIVEVGVDSALVLYDLQTGAVVEEVTAYGEALAGDLQLETLSIQHELGHLRVFWTYLANMGVSLSRVNDAVLAEFRDAAFAAAKRSPSHRNDPEAAKKTVNAKLVRVYDWLLWLKEKGRVPHHTIGSDACQVRTALSRSSIRAVNLERQQLPQLAKYPLLLRLKAGKSKHAMPKEVPTETSVDLLFEHFHQVGTEPFLIERNCLLVGIPAETGFRRGSLQSLTVDQFVGSTVVRTETDTVVVQPSRQKLGYANTFEIPYLLHVSITRFIETFWKPYVKENGFPEKVHQQHLFISDSGTPLRNGSITAIVSKAMRAIGFQKGTAVHAFRAKAAVERMLDEYEDRAAAGLSTSPDAIDRALAKAMGWRDPESARPYTSSYEASRVAAKRAGRLRSRSEDKEKIRQLEEQVAALKLKIERGG